MNEQLIWTRLFNESTRKLRARAHPVFWGLVNTLELKAHEFPNLSEINQTLQEISGWRLTAADVTPEVNAFATLLQEKTYAVSIHLRPRIERHDCKRDLWEDVFGRVPFLLHPIFSKLYQMFGAAWLAAESKSPILLRSLGEIYWYTMRFGLVYTSQGIRVFGSELIANPVHVEKALSRFTRKRSFNLKEISQRQHKPGIPPSEYFVLNSFDQLETEVDQWLTRHGLTPEETVPSRLDLSHNDHRLALPMSHLRHAP